MTTKQLIGLGAAATLALAACKAKQPQAPESPFPAKEATSAQPSTPAPGQPPRPGPSAEMPLSGNLMTPSKANETAPETFKARFSTTKGDFIIEAHRSWSPNGADRFYNLVRAGFFDDAAFFRAVKGFMVQYGMSGKPDVMAAWGGAQIADDQPTGQSNKRGMVTFAMAGKNTRTTQLFINFGDNGNLDSIGFTPFGVVTQGMDVVDQLYTGYGDFPSFGGRGPNPSRIASEGNAYLKSAFPMMDYTKTARILQ